MRRLALSLFLLMVAGVLHLSLCEWRALEPWLSAMSLPDGSSVYLLGDEDGVREIGALEALAEQVKLRARSFWVHQDRNGRGFGLYARTGVEVETARWLGLIFPIGLLILAPLLASVRAARSDQSPPPAQQLLPSHRAMKNAL